MECWNVMNSIIPLFAVPRCLHRPNLCQGPGIAPCLWKNPRRPATSWWRTLRPLSALLWRNPRCVRVGVKDRPCLVVESPEPTEDRAGTTSPVPFALCLPAFRVGVPESPVPISGTKSSIPSG